MRRRMGAICTLLTILVLLPAGCGGGGTLDLDRHTAGFELTVLPGTLLQGSSAGGFSLAVDEGADGALVAINAQDAVRLKALYFTLAYDATRWAPAAVDGAGLLGADEQLLRLDVLTQPGTVHSGQVLIHPELEAGFSGDGTLATVRFGPGPAPAARAASVVPYSEQSRTALQGDGTDTLSWRYLSQGDYNMDKLVGVSDLTPLGVNFDAEGPFDPNSALSAVDGNVDGFITVSDITPIGQNFGSLVQAFNLYHSNVPLDYPPGPLADNGATTTFVAAIDFEDRELIDGERPLFSYQVSAPEPGGQYWVRPTDGELLGVASRPYSFSGGASEVTFSIGNPPDEGLGTAEDPFVVETGDNLQLILTHATEGDVTTSEDAELSLSDAAYGLLDHDTGWLYLGGVGSGAFYVSATYQGLATTPPRWYMRMIDGEAPLLTFVNAPLTGSGLSTDPFIIDTASTYVFSLFSATAGEVAGDPLTEWLVSAPAAGSIVQGATSASLNVEDDYQGSFSVGASYAGELSYPARIYLRVPGDAPVLSLNNPPDYGTGKALSPYQVEYFVPDGGPSLSFTLVDPLDGDVSINGSTGYSVSDASAGSIEPGSNVLLVPMGYEGVFYVSAQYEGRLSIPQALWIETIPIWPGPEPEAAITADPQASDIVPVEVTLDASESVAGTGSIESFDWDFEGDGEWDMEDGTEAQVAHTYAGTGVFNPAVRVWDSANASDTATVDVTITDEGNYWPVAELTADSSGGDVPLTVNFDASGSSDAETPPASLHFVWDLDGDGIYEHDGGSVPTVAHEYTSPGHIWPSVKVYDEQSAWDYAEVELTLSAAGNLPPTAALSADNVHGSPPMEVAFNAGDSIDEDGTIVQYRWDFDGDGSFDETTAGPTTTHTYYDIDTFVALVEVEDDDGATDDATIPITVEPHGGWIPTAVVTPDGEDILSAGDYCALAELDGRPVIAYQDTKQGTEYTKKRAMFISATDSMGMGWGSPVVIRAPALEQESSGIDIDLGIVWGRPAVCFAERAWESPVWTYNLYFERAMDAAGASWSGASVGVDTGSSDSRGTHCRLAVIDDNPAISYFDLDDQHLYYCRATGGTGSAWNAPQLLDDNSGVTSAYASGEFNSLAVIDGAAAVSYLTRVSEISAGYHLRFIRASDTVGGSWYAPLSADVAQQIAQGTSLGLLGDGWPAIAYTDPAQDRLLFVKGSADDGSSWATPSVAATTSGDFGAESPVFLLADGRPAVAFIDASTGGSQVKFVRALDANGTSWQAAETVATLGGFGTVVDAAIVSGMEAVCYQDDLTGTLWFAICVPLP